MKGNGVAVPVDEEYDEGRGRPRRAHGPDTAAASGGELGVIEHRLLLGRVPHIRKEAERGKGNVPGQEPGEVVGQGHVEKIGRGTAEVPQVDEDPGRAGRFHEGLLEIRDDPDPPGVLGRELPVVVGHDDGDAVLRSFDVGLGPSPGVGGSGEDPLDGRGPLLYRSHGIAERIDERPQGLFIISGRRGAANERDRLDQRGVPVDVLRREIRMAELDEPPKPAETRQALDRRRVRGRRSGPKTSHNEQKRESPCQILHAALLGVLRGSLPLPRSLRVRPELPGGPVRRLMNGINHDLLSTD